MGRPDGYGLHAELGDVFVTVNPMGITLVVADPDVAAYICGRRAEFPKPPNTGGEYSHSELLPEAAAESQVLGAWSHFLLLSHWLTMPLRTQPSSTSTDAM